MSPPQTYFRAANLAPASANEADRTIEVRFTAGASVRRFTYTDGEVDEVLSTEPNAVDLTRLNKGAPFLNSHRSYDVKDVLGSVVPGSARMESGAGYATIKVSDRPEADPIWADLQSGVLRNVSVGYSVERYEIEKTDGARPIYRAVQWTPMEISLVAIGADADAQTRSHDPLAAPATISQRGNPMTEQTDILAAERTRAAEIHNLCTRFGIAQRAGEMIERGDTVEQVRAAVLDHLAAQTAPALGGSAAVFDPMGGSTALTANAVAVRNLTAILDPEAAPANTPRTVRNFDDAAVLWAEQSGLGRLSVSQAVRSFHTSSDFPLITANVLGNAVGRRLGQMPPAILGAARAVMRDNYHTGNLLGMTAASALNFITEGEEIKYVTINETGEAMPVPADLGGIFNITNRALVQDYSGVMAGVRDAMVRAANERLRSVALAPLLANSGAGQTMRDGNPAFHVSRNNVAASGTAITVTSVSAAILALRTQTGPTGERLAIEPWGMLVHPANEASARQVLAQINANVTTAVNPWAGTLQLMIEPGLTSTTGWYVMADPASVDGLFMGYLDGMMQPEILTRSSWNNLGQEMRLTWALDAKFVQPIAWYRNAGA